MGYVDAAIETEATDATDLALPNQCPGKRRFDLNWSGLGLLGVVALGAFLCFWRLDQNGLGQEYYASGVKSATQSWHNFFYMSFDPAGFISLDKPPLAFWIQAFSAKVFGFSSWSVLGVQGVATMASIAVVHHLVRARFGAVRWRDSSLP